MRGGGRGCRLWLWGRLRAWGACALSNFVEKGEESDEKDDEPDGFDVVEGNTAVMDVNMRDGEQPAGRKARDAAPTKAADEIDEGGAKGADDGRQSAQRGDGVAPKKQRQHLQIMEQGRVVQKSSRERREWLRREAGRRAVARQESKQPHLAFVAMHRGEEGAELVHAQSKGEHGQSNDEQPI